MVLQKLMVTRNIEFEQTTAVLNIWKESLIKLLARVNCGKVSTSNGSADDSSKVIMDIVLILQEAAGKNISVKNMKDRAYYSKTVCRKT